MNLREYISAYCWRGACQCGRCIDAPDKPENHQPTEHTADLVFFKVSIKTDPSSKPSAEKLRELIKETKGEFCEIDLFDGKEHNYLEIGGWIGDQGLALMLMGMGELLGLWQLITPKMFPMLFNTKELIDKMAGIGMITIIPKKDDTLANNVTAKV